jgi:hypothetical protein
MGRSSLGTALDGCATFLRAEGLEPDVVAEENRAHRPRSRTLIEQFSDAYPRASEDRVPRRQTDAAGLAVIEQ